MSEPSLLFKRVLEALGTAAALASVALLVVGTPVRSEAQSDRSKPLPYLLDVGDMVAQVRYSPGALDRASHVQHRFALLAEDFQKWSKKALPVGAVLLSRTDWEALDLAVPYGLPTRLANGEVALCAWGDLGTVTLWRGLLEGPLPRLDGHPLYGSVVEASSLLLTDLLAQGVAARGLLERAGYNRVHPDVLNFAAHVVALAASNLHERLSLAEIRRVYSITAPEPAGRASEDQVWRARLAGETPYYLAAEALIAKRGSSRAPRALLKLLERSGSGLTMHGVVDKFPEIRGLLPVVGS